MKQILLLFCLGGFLFLSRDQFIKYISHATGISIGKVPVPGGERNYPVMVFCPKKPFLRAVGANETKEEYEANFHPTFNVDYVGKFMADHEYLPDSAYKKSYLPTLYNGRCEVFEMTRKVKTMDLLAFQWTRKEEATFFLFQKGAVS